jgi:hypothetical protein
MPVMVDDDDGNGEDVTFGLVSRKALRLALLLSASITSWIGQAGMGHTHAYTRTDAPMYAWHGWIRLPMNESKTNYAGMHAG